MSSEVPDRRRWRGGLLAVGGLVLAASDVAVLALTPGAVEATSTAWWIRVCLLVLLVAALALVAANVQWVRTGAAPRGPLTAALALGVLALAGAVLGASYFLVQDGPDATSAPAMGLFVVILAGVGLLLTAVSRREGT